MLKKPRTVILVLFLFLLAHALYVDATSSKCSNFQNRSCSAAVFKVWEW